MGSRQSRQHHPGTLPDQLLNHTQAGGVTPRRLFYRPIPCYIMAPKLSKSTHPASLNVLREGEGSEEGAVFCFQGSGFGMAFFEGEDKGGVVVKQFAG